MFPSPLGMTRSPAADSRGVDLDSPPPQPPTGASPRAPGLPSPLVSSPHVTAVKGMQEIINGAKLLATVLPGMMPMVADTIERLKETVPRALAELASGSQSSMPMGAGPMGPQGPQGPPGGGMMPAPMQSTGAGMG